MLSRCFYTVLLFNDSETWTFWIFSTWNKLSFSLSHCFVTFIYHPSYLFFFFFYLVLSFSLTCLYSVFYIDWRSMKLIDSFISCVVCYWQSEWLRSHAKSKITLILSNGKASEPAFKMCFILVIRVKHQTSKHL